MFVSCVIFNARVGYLYNLYIIYFLLTIILNDEFKFLFARKVACIIPEISITRKLLSAKKNHVSITQRGLGIFQKYFQTLARYRDVDEEKSIALVVYLVPR